MSSVSAQPRIEPTAPQLASVQMWRAAAAFLVLLYHLATTPAHAWAETNGRRNWLNLFEAIGFAGVDLFFVISGVVMTVTCFRRLGEPREVGAFLKRRVARIYPLYWACLAAVIALGWLVPGLTRRSKTDGLEILRSIVLWPQDDYPLVGVAWTLTFEMFFYVVFAALIALPRRWFLPALGAWALVVLALYPALDDPAYTGIRGNLQLPLYASPLVLEFIAGCFIGWRLASGPGMPLAGSALGAGLALLVVGGGYFGTVDNDLATYGMPRVAVFGVASVLIIYGSAGLERAGRWWTSRPLCFWGDASYSLYLTHVYVILAFGAIYARWPAGQNGWPKVGLFVTCLATCGIVAAACHLWVERPLTAAARRLLDGRWVGRGGVEDGAALRYGGPSRRG
jgi:peptidoglycan/LPS O-acetylase OafA/YrhL